MTLEVWGLFIGVTIYQCRYLFVSLFNRVTGLKLMLMYWY